MALATIISWDEIGNETQTFNLELNPDDDAQVWNQQINNHLDSDPTTPWADVPDETWWKIVQMANLRNITILVLKTPHGHQGTTQIIWPQA